MGKTGFMELNFLTFQTREGLKKCQNFYINLNKERLGSLPENGTGPVDLSSGPLAPDPHFTVELENHC